MRSCLPLSPGSHCPVYFFEDVNFNIRVMPLALPIDTESRLVEPGGPSLSVYHTWLLAICTP